MAKGLGARRKTLQKSVEASRKARPVEDRLARARSQGLARFAAIAQMVEELRTAIKQDQEGDADETEAPRRQIEEDALSVQVRGDWHNPGDKEGVKPTEYEILLCTGGPACRIVGDLSEYCEPETATIEVQDWFTPWTVISAHDGLPEDYGDILLEYARCFYFGEG